MQTQSATTLGAVLEGRYRVTRLLGQGGAGAVYLAEDTQLFDRPVAIKELIEQFNSPEERAGAVARFVHEARMLVSLSHPNLPDVRSYFTEHGRHYLVMEYIEGDTLLEVLERSGGALPPALVLEWGRQICGVLSYLHGRTPPVIFRDLKPSNIMLDRANKIQLIDFGTARLFDTTKHTDTLKMGSIGYAPPEQYQGQGQTSPQTDIYALGATLHQLLTNQDPSARPFVFAPPSLLRPEVHESASRAIMRALNLDPAQRFATADDFARALTPATGDEHTALLRVTRRAQHPLLAACFALLGAALLEVAALAPELSHLGQGTASADWAVDYLVLIAPALGAALGGALAPGYQPRPLQATVLAFFGAILLSGVAGLAVIYGVGHHDAHQISLKLLAAVALPAAVVGSTLLRAGSA